MKLNKSENMDVPHGNSVVWRYMNNWKFEQLLDSSSIYFPNAQKLSDQYEVSIPKSVITQKKQELELSGLSENELKIELERFYWQHDPIKERVLINCWSVNPYESYALWKIYLGGERNGIAIKSTVARLSKALSIGGDLYPEEYFMGKVKYQKHLTQDQLNRFNIILTKKPYYDFEKELRLFLIANDNAPYQINEGRTVQVKLDMLINKIYISPFAEPDYKEFVFNELTKTGLNNIDYLVKDSDIEDK